VVGVLTCPTCSGACLLPDPHPASTSTAGIVSAAIRHLIPCLIVYPFPFAAALDLAVDAGAVPDEPSSSYFFRSAADALLEASVPPPAGFCSGWL
jgi:hypothetical protein